MSKNIIKKYKKLKSKLDFYHFQLYSYHKYLELCVNQRKAIKMTLHIDHNNYYVDQTEINYNKLIKTKNHYSDASVLIKKLNNSCIYYKQKVKEIKSKLSNLI